MELKPKDMPEVVELPAGELCGGNCVGCIYWNPHDRDRNDRQYCSYHDKYFYPGDRNGCFARKT